MYRKGKTKTENGETVFNEKYKVYDSIPCAVSFGSVGKINQTNSVAKATKECSLFVRPEIEILTNDIVEVNRLGKVTEYLAGEYKDYVSHWMITLVRKEGDLQ